MVKRSRQPLSKDDEKRLASALRANLRKRKSLNPSKKVVPQPEKAKTTTAD